MMDKGQVLDLLGTALNDEARRSETIKRFQSAVFDGDQRSLGLNDVEWDIVTQLAQDLDYYEPDEGFRREDPSFYGDARVEAEIKEALLKMIQSTSSTPDVNSGN